MQAATASQQPGLHTTHLKVHGLADLRRHLRVQLLVQQQAGQALGQARQGVVGAAIVCFLA